jgi:flagellar hook-associated protein 3 FlgL
LKQLFSERFAADSGADGLGRLAVSGSGATVTLAETGSGLPFGIKLSTITSGLANATITQASGTPPSESVVLTGQPTIGDQITFNFSLPDGTTTSLALAAASADGIGQFVVGATPNDTAQNFKTALSSALATLVQTDLKSASAIYTAKNFFASNATNPPERISGTPATSATTTIAGTASDTMIWYQGKTDGNDPRADRRIQIGDNLSVEYGVRANESGFQSVLSGIAASLLVTSSFSNTSEIAAKQMESVRNKTLQITKDGQIGMQSIVGSIASAQSTAKLIQDQNKSVKALLQTRLSGLEDASPEETATQITSLTTQLQASYQVAAKLLNLSLAAYL